MAAYVPNARQQFCDANGTPLAAGSVGMYVVGTLTPSNSWQDAAATTLNDNPIPLDSGGFATIYGNGAYRQIVKDQAGNTIWDRVVTPNSVATDGVGTANYGQLSSGSTNSLDIERYASAAPDGTTQWYANVHRIYAQGANAWDFAREAYRGTHVQGSGVVNNAEGVHQYVWGEANAVISNSKGVSSHFRLDAGASLTVEHDNFRAVPSTLTSATAVRIVGFSCGDIGGAGVSNAIGVEVTDITASSLVVGVRCVVNSGTGKFAFTSEGTAPSAHLGKYKFGAIGAAAEAIDNAGNYYGQGYIKTTAGGIGYAPGAGGTVTQITSKSTGVSLNALCGSITLNNAALAATTIVSFTFTNTQIGADDRLDAWIKGGNATPGSYRVQVEGNASNSRTIIVENKTAGSLSEALVLGFNILKAVVS